MTVSLDRAMSAAKDSSQSLRPGEVCKALLAALEAADGLTSSRKFTIVRNPSSRFAIVFLHCFRLVPDLLLYPPKFSQNFFPKET